jgi:TolA-binding protein
MIFRRHHQEGVSGARRAGRWGALILCAAVLSTSCAYFNTFYHAKKYYAKAQEAQQKSRSDKLSPEAAANYDKAIEKCAKVIMQHGGGWRAGIDEALFLMGASYYGKKEYETAIKKFDELVFNYPESDHVPEALFYTGLSYHRMRNYPTATRIFARLVREYPDFDRKDEILLTAAEGLELEFDYRSALREYRQILEESGTREVREKALERMGKIYFDEGEYDSALVAYQDLANTTRDDELYFEAQLNVGACLVRLGENGDALDIYHRVLPEDAERNENGGRVWLAMAEAENRRGRYGGPAASRSSSSRPSGG